MEDSMVDMPNLVFDEKIGTKRVRDGEEEVTIGRLEKRPSGILGVNGGGGGDYVGDGGEKGGQSGGGGDGSGGGIIDTFISSVFHKSESGMKEEENGQEKNDVFDVENEDKRDGLGGDGDGGGKRGGGGGGGEDGDGGGIISGFFSNMFHHNGNADNGGGGDGRSGAAGDGDGDGGGGGGEVEELNEEKLEKKDPIVDELASKDVAGGQKVKMKPDDYSERVFFLNSN